MSDKGKEIEWNLKYTFRVITMTLWRFNGYQERNQSEIRSYNYLNLLDTLDTLRTQTTFLFDKAKII